MCQFAAQASFLIIVIAVSTIVGLEAVATAHFSQGLNFAWSGFFFYLGWKILPTRPASHPLPESKTLITQSFVQVWQTTKKINKLYSHSLRWFLLAVVFAEAAANAFTVVSVVFLDEQIGFSTQEIGIFFLITLIFTLPGSRLGAWVTHKTSPTISYQIVMLLLMITATVGAFILEEGRTFVAYGWGAFIGVELGWYYPVENLAFSILLPKGQEAEIAGFFVYCTQILGWLPPLIFSALVEADIHQKYGIMAVQVFFGIAIGIIFLLPKWDDAVAEIVMQDKINAAAADEEGAVEKDESPAIRDVVKATEDVDQPSALGGI
jgi:MFS-type transporter involved in bile tolerance (Atg22 family)